MHKYTQNTQVYRSLGWIAKDTDGKHVWNTLPYQNFSGGREAYPFAGMQIFLVCSRCGHGREYLHAFAVMCICMWDAILQVRVCMQHVYLVDIL
jgi:hypothetical protein